MVIKYFVYILKSRVAGKSYVGYTNNLNHRLKQHNLGQSYFTKRYAPWDILYTEEFDNIKDAKNRERYLKSSSGRRLVLKKLFE